MSGQRKAWAAVAAKKRGIGLNRAQATRKTAERTATPKTPERVPERSFSLVLPWPPTANHATKHTTTGQHYLTAEYKAFSKAVLVEVFIHPIKMIQGRYAAKVWFHPPDRRRRDCDNVEKTLWDALVKAGAIEDDCNLREKLVRWCDPDGSARVVLDVYEVS